MNLILQGLAWIFTPSHWVTSVGNVSITTRIGEHFYYTGVSLLVTVLIAVPIGLAIGHTGKGRGIAIVLSNASRALPTLGLLAVLILGVGIGLLPVAIVLVILGIPPLLAGVYSGLESVDRQTIDAARAMGMTELQILVKVEIPLGFELIFGGFRAATLQIIATVTLAAYYSLGGLGHYLVFGLAQNDYPQMVAGAILVIVLALAVDGILAVIQRFVVPGVSRGTTRQRRTARGGAIPPVAQSRTLIKEGQ
jgi:osmoprotectant transport system permease protein